MAAASSLLRSLGSAGATFVDFRAHLRRSAQPAAGGLGALKIARRKFPLGPAFSQPDDCQDNSHPCSPTPRRAKGATWCAAHLPFRPADRRPTTFPDCRTANFRTEDMHDESPASTSTSPQWGRPSTRGAPTPAAFSALTTRSQSRPLGRLSVRSNDHHISDAVLPARSICTISFRLRIVQGVNRSCKRACCRALCIAPSGPDALDPKGRREGRFGRPRTRRCSQCLLLHGDPVPLRERWGR